MTMKGALSEADNLAVWLSRSSVKLVHARELDPTIKRSGRQPTCIDAGPAGIDRGLRIAENLFVAVWRADRHQLGTGAFDCH